MKVNKHVGIQREWRDSEAEEGKKEARKVAWTGLRLRDAASPEESMYGGRKHNPRNACVEMFECCYPSCSRLVKDDPGGLGSTKTV